MTLTLLAFLTLVLFILHEFEEIIRIRPWIARNSGNPKFAKEIFIAGRERYPSAETMTALILEEFLLVSLLFLAGILLPLPELILAVTLVHTAHLFVHIAQAVTFRAWVPGSITAFMTLPLLVLSIALYCLGQALNGWLLLGLTVFIFIILLGNLRFLHRQANKLERFLHR